jgi:predicted nucleotidyltransferase
MNTKKYLNKDTLMDHMIQKCGYMKTLEVFFKEPTKIHFIRSISRKINLAQTSVRNHIKFLIKNKMILEKKSNPFNGYVSNRENKEFIFYKSIYNLASLKNLNEFIINSCYPKSLVLFGSYLRGEDIESSDIDFFVLSKTKKEFNLTKFEKTLGRKINILFSDSLEKLDKKIQNKIKNGFVLEGEI